MSTIFKLHTGGPTVNDWGNTVNYPYDRVERATIEDPNGANATKEITSIPSPFARIDLVKSAFGQVCTPDKHGNINLNGNTIFHKMVSDTLDVAEIFYNIGNYAGQLEIIRWNPKGIGGPSDINALKASPNPGTQHLGDALEKYMLSAPAGSNFSLLQGIYLLNYKLGPTPLNIIGATSPSTLFFSNANNLPYVNGIYFGDGAQPFTGTFRPLYQRDPGFVDYIFALRNHINTIANFANLFPEVNEYLDKTFTQISQANAVRAHSLSVISLGGLTLNPINVADGAAVFVAEVLGHKLYSKSNAFNAANCEFKIAATKAVAGNVPLVLPTENGAIYASLQYGGGTWGVTNKAPFIDFGGINSRTLPANGSTYPYLTVSDFLEDRIIRVPHTLNKEHYFDGNLTGNDPGEAYLLPLKPLSFDYFTADDLTAKKMPDDSKPMIEMNVLAGGSVKVTLRIPITANDGHRKYVEYTRIYEPNPDPQISTNSNIGAVTNLLFAGFVMPMVKFAAPAEAIYNVSCLQYTLDNEFTFFDDNTSVVPATAPTCRNIGYQLVKGENYLIKGSNFDLIRVTNRSSGYSGIIVPRFAPQITNTTFEFAVDLGTSNTHIEYRDSNNQAVRPFTFDNNDSQLCPMFTGDNLTIETELSENDYIPMAIGARDSRFPTRTVLSFAKSASWTNVINPYGMANIPFYYDKRILPGHNNTQTNLKWLDDPAGQAQLTVYIRNLMLMLRNKVVLNGGDLKNTIITWFYPISMEPWRKNGLSNAWMKAYQEYFGGSIGNVHDITESAAPIKYWFGQNAIANRMVNIDIGGGTTDIAFASGGTVGQVTSFRFAADSLFSNTLASGDNKNGIIDLYFPQILNTLRKDNDEDETKKLNDLIKIGDELVAKDSNPADKASFLFGLKDNEAVINAEVNPFVVDFNRMLSQDREFKIVFILFYTSIIYHVAQIAKSRGDTLPPNVITFSGNGSKVLNIITSDAGTLANYTKEIFNQLGLEYGAGQGLEIMGLDGSTTAKTATCKGGITIGAGAAMGTPIIFRSDNNGVVELGNTKLQYKHVQQEIGGMPNPDFNRDYMRAVEKSVNDFFEFALETLPGVFSFNRNFNVNPTAIQTAKEISTQNIRDLLQRGICNLTTNNQSMLNSQIEETLFFYPIKGVLNNLSTAIYKEKTVPAANAAGEA